MRTEFPCALFVSNYFIEIQRLIFHGPETSKTCKQVFYEGTYRTYAPDKNRCLTKNCKV